MTSAVPFCLVAILPVPMALAFPLAHVPKREFQELWQKLPQEDKVRVSHGGTELSEPPGITPLPVTTEQTSTTRLGPVLPPSGWEAASGRAAQREVL